MPSDGEAHEREKRHPSIFGVVGESLTRRRLVMGAGSTAVLAGLGVLSAGCGATTSPLPVRQTSRLAPPRLRGPVSVEDALAHRRSGRRSAAERAGDLPAAVGGAGSHRRLGRSHQSIGGSAGSTWAVRDHPRCLQPLPPARTSARVTRRTGHAPRDSPRRTETAGYPYRASRDRDRRRVSPDGEEIRGAWPSLRRTRDRSRRAGRAAAGDRARPRGGSDRGLRRSAAGRDTTSRRPRAAVHRRRRSPSHLQVVVIVIPRPQAVESAPRASGKPGPQTRPERDPARRSRHRSTETDETTEAATQSAGEVYSKGAPR